jgi:hypothetical protein
MLKGDDYPSPERPMLTMSSELASQAAAVAAAITEAEGHGHGHQQHEHEHEHDPNHTHSHAHEADLHHSLELTRDVNTMAALPASDDAHTHAHTHTHMPAPPLPAPLDLRTPYRRAPPFQFAAPHRQAPDSPLSNGQQLAVLRECYARNPNPSKREYELMAEKTGRPWNKIREYFRQRRNKLRGLADLEGMEEPGRATGW